MPLPLPLPHTASRCLAVAILVLWSSSRLATRNLGAHGCGYGHGHGRPPEQYRPAAGVGDRGRRHRLTTRDLSTGRKKTNCCEHRGQGWQV